MPSKTELLQQQRNWADLMGLKPDILTHRVIIHTMSDQVRIFIADRKKEAYEIYRVHSTITKMYRS